MAGEKGSTYKLGLFVLAGTVVLMLGLYMLGKKRDLFSRTIAITARFPEVNGLRVGNNVRYAGIDVGTVESVTILNDTVIEVGMLIRLDAAEHIRSSAVARIASDGLMGNKLVNIEPGESTGTALSDGAELTTEGGLDTDAMLRSLSRSNDNVVAITSDLRALSQRLNSDRGLLAVLDDTTLADDLRAVMKDVREAAGNARMLTQRADDVVRDLQDGRGALGVLTSDTGTEQRVRHLMVNLSHLSDSLAVASDRMARFTDGLVQEGGLGHTLTRDTALVSDLKRVIANLDTSSATLNEDLRALQRNWFFRKYFKEKAREDRKAAP